MNNKKYMQTMIKIGRTFYGLAMVVYGIQQFVYANFRNVQFPKWQSSLPLLPVWAYSTGLGLIIAGIAIILGKKARTASLIIGGFFLLLFICVHFPFEIFGEEHSSLHFALWTDALKELALSGGAFVIAGCLPEDNTRLTGESLVITLLEKLIPLGRIFFCITMISFGIMHFMYTQFVSTLMPARFPDPVFWTYFGAVALIGSGVAIILSIRQGAIALLLSIMLFLWVILLHMPRAIAEPLAARGNEVSSAFDALAFSGIALVIATRKVKTDLNEIFN
ncbi:DoxX family membrane protein [Rhodocytophaga rosea]|uniref:DoxX family membrane protein n=1 Tax=Rhodocytophaga rosea TaxID=2704465 RepID=A0A6C0GMI3_9BACT|nr:DoxX family membrane protein [Rhodocytophaga rosea]QHT68812.1 DoxX family membrane protein [Rhodocytophaga rosea]